MSDRARQIVRPFSHPNPENPRLEKTHLGLTKLELYVIELLKARTTATCVFPDATDIAQAVWSAHAALAALDTACHSCGRQRSQHGTVELNGAAPLFCLNKSCSDFLRNEELMKSLPDEYAALRAELLSRAYEGQ